MTTAPSADLPDRLADVLRIYAEHPLDEGDAVLLLDDQVCLEMQQLALDWGEEVRQSIAAVVRSTAARLLVAIARPRCVLLDSDYQLWRDLHAELRRSNVQLLPLRGLPAA